MKNFFSLLLTILIVGSINAQDQKWTLQECVQRALENNISIRQSELDVKTAEIAKLDAVGNFLPSISANARVSKSTGLSFDPTTQEPTTIKYLSASGGLSMGYTLFDGLKNFREVQRAKISGLAAQYNLEKMQDDILLYVANGFLQVLLNKENLKVLQAQNEVTIQQIERTQQLVDGGVLPRGDLLEVRAQNATEIQSIVTAENNVKISLISLAQILLIKDYKTFDIAADIEYEIAGEEILLKSPEEILTNAKEERSEIKIAEQNVALAEKDIQLARGNYFPTLSAFFGYDTRYSDTDIVNRFWDQLSINDGYSYGLSLNIPILNGLSVRNNVSRSKINLERSKINLEQATLDLESTVYQSYLDAQGALKAYEASQVAAESQALAYDYAKERYDVGLTNAFDYSQAKQRYDNSQIELNRTKYDYIFRLKVLELYFGIPISELKF